MFWFELSKENKFFCCFFLSTSRFNWQRKKRRKKVSDKVAISVTASDDGGCWHSWYVEMRRLGCDHTDWSDVIEMLTKNMWRSCRATIILNASLPGKKRKNKTNHTRASLPAINSHPPFTSLTPFQTCKQISKLISQIKPHDKPFQKQKYEEKKGFSVIRK